MFKASLFPARPSHPFESFTNTPCSPLLTCWSKGTSNLSTSHLHARLSVSVCANTIYNLRRDMKRAWWYTSGRASISFRGLEVSSERPVESPRTGFESSTTVTAACDPARINTTRIAIHYCYQRQAQNVADKHWDTASGRAPFACFKKVTVSSTVERCEKLKESTTATPI